MEKILIIDEEQTKSIEIYLKSGDIYFKNYQGDELLLNINNLPELYTKIVEIKNMIDLYNK